MVSLGWKITERVKVGEQGREGEGSTFFYSPDFELQQCRCSQAQRFSSQLLGGHKCFNKYNTTIHFTHVTV